jgi:hypothetical protein
MTTTTENKTSNAIEFRNASKVEFKDLSSELYREYSFAKDGKTVKVRIDNPLKLAVSESGGHRVFDAAGVSHYIPSGWHHLQWEVKEGKPHFDF